MTPFKSGKKSTDDHNHPPPSGRTAALRTYLDLLAVPQRPLLPGADLLPLRRQMPQTPEPQPPATEKHAGVTAMTRTIELTDDMHQDEPLSRYTARDRTYAVMTTEFRLADATGWHCETCANSLGEHCGASR